MRDLTARARTGLLAAGWLAATLAGSALAQQPQQALPASPVAPPVAAPPLRQFQVMRAATPVRIDGALDDDVWKTATVVDLPYEWFPGDNATPPVKTEALVTYDGDNLYVGFRCHDPNPKAIRAHLMDRDALGPFLQDDHVGFSVDTFNDERHAFQFRVNPRGVQVDGTFSEANGAEDFSWDAIWNAASRITADGWEAEIAIPLRQLRFPRTTGPQTWGFDLFRSYPRSVRHRITSRYTDRAKDCILCQENKISGFQGMAPGRNLELDPTLTGLRSDTLDAFPNGHLQKDKSKVDPGLTARWGVTPNVTLSAAINPDFSQVEADVAQLAINTRFALFFPEKRPFFLEGADLFITPLQAVFTRTVAEPRWGAKVDAKEGKNSLGLFLAEDRINNFIIPSNQSSGVASLDDDVDSAAFRFRRDVGERSALGVLYTDREGKGDDYHNRMAGLDGFFRFTPSDTIRVQYLRSDTRYPLAIAQSAQQPLDSFDDDAYHLQYDHFAQNWKGFIFYQDLGPDFRADSGFIPRVDVRTAEGQFERFFYGDKESWYAQTSVGFHALRTENHQGLLTDQSAELFASYTGALQSALDVHYLHNKTFFDGTTFDLDQQVFNFAITPTGGLRLGLSAQFGDDIDFDNSRPARSVTWLPSIGIRLGQHLNVNASYQDARLWVADGQLFDARLAQTRIVYQFNVRTFVRAIVQYQDIERDPSLYLFPVGSRRRDLFGQFLFSYKINPQTVLFTGYTNTQLGRFGIPLTQTDRTFFLKIGYALLF
ncbi:MAG: hypothetical protein QOF89_4256 [Acidobacteriota bacterium]|nr:hypothetical protein [Acidobacteriota bacterium]